MRTRKDEIKHKRKYFANKINNNDANDDNDITMMMNRTLTLDGQHHLLGTFNCL